MPSSTHPLPRDFFELYQSYKRKTQRVVVWLKQVCQPQDTSIATLVAAAQRVTKQKITIPAELYYIFKNALDLAFRFRLIFETLFPQPSPATSDSSAKRVELSATKENNRFTILPEVLDDFEISSGNVLHAYNLLRLKGFLKKPIPILEKLCEMLHDAVFLGHRPTTNFHSALYRFQGGKTGSRLTADPHSGAEAGRSHFIATPKHLPHLGAQDRRIKPEELSKVYMAHLDFFRLQPMLSKCDKNAFGPRWAKKKRSSSEKVWGPGPAYASDKDYDEEDWTTHGGRNTIRRINHELRGEINLLDEDSFPPVRVNGFAVYSLFRDIHNRLWTENKHRYISAQFLDCPDAGATFERLTVTAGGAVIIGALMDFVDGEGKNSFKFDGNQVHYKQGEKPVLMMEIVADAILRATEGKDQSEQYLWKHM